MLIHLSPSDLSQKLQTHIVQMPAQREVVPLEFLTDISNSTCLKLSSVSPGNVLHHSLLHLSDCLLSIPFAQIKALDSLLISLSHTSYLK